MLTKCFVDRFNSSYVLTNKIVVNPEETIIRREGSRMVDTADFTLSANFDVKIGDFIGFLYDNINLEQLQGLWNFYGSGRDESGNDVHEVDAYTNVPLNTTATYTKITTGENVRGKRSRKIINTELAPISLKIPDKRIKDTTGTETVYSIFDFSGDFTITMWIRPSINLDEDPQTTNVIFDKYNDNTNQGIKIYFEKVSTIVYLKVKVGNGISSTTYSVVITQADYHNKDKLYVFRRIGTQCKLKVNDVDLISETNSDDFTTRADIHLGREFTETGTSGNNYTGSLAANTGLTITFHQMRIYTRGLSDDELTTFFLTIVPKISLKFYGQVWKIEDNGSTSKYYCKGIGAIALNTNLNTNIFDDNNTSRVDYKRYKNIFQPADDGVNAGEIINECLTKINKLNFTTTNPDRLYAIFAGKVKNEVLYELSGDYIAEGNFVDILNQLLVMDDVNTTFTFLPTGVLILEEDTAISLSGGSVFTKENSNLLKGGYDKSPLINKLYSIGRITPKTSSYSPSAICTIGSWSISAESGVTDLRVEGENSQTAKVTSFISVSKAGIEIDRWTSTTNPTSPYTTNYYKYDDYTGIINFWSTTTGTISFKLKFNYNNNLADLNTSFKSTSISLIESDETSIAKHGLYSRKISVPQLTVNADVLRFATKVIDKNSFPSGIPRRITIETSGIINHLLENVNNVDVYYTSKDIEDSTSTEEIPVALTLPVRRIQYNFPEGKTIIEVGDLLYDSFDLEKESSETQRQILSQQTG